MMEGEILAETDSNGDTTAEYIFFGGKRIAMIPFSGSPPAAGNPAYYVEDMLGTSRVITRGLLTSTHFPLFSTAYALPDLQAFCFEAVATLGGVGGTRMT